MKQRNMVSALGLLATLLYGAPGEAAGKKHLIIVYAAKNTGQGAVTVDKGKLHLVPLDASATGDCVNKVCGASYARGTRVTLTATAAEGSTFAGWGGECEGTAPTCVVRLSRSRDVLAHFTK